MATEFNTNEINQIATNIRKMEDSITNLTPIEEKIMQINQSVAWKKESNCYELTLKNTMIIWDKQNYYVTWLGNPWHDNQFQIWTIINNSPKTIGFFNTFSDAEKSIYALHEDF
jgi:hypothetical protein